MAKKYQEDLPYSENIRRERRNLFVACSITSIIAISDTCNVIGQNMLGANITIDRPILNILLSIWCVAQFISFWRFRIYEDEKFHIYRGDILNRLRWAKDDGLKKLEIYKKTQDLRIDPSLTDDDLQRELSEAFPQHVRLTGSSPYIDELVKQTPTGLQQNIENTQYDVKMTESRRRNWTIHNYLILWWDRRLTYGFVGAAILLSLIDAVPAWFPDLPYGYRWIDILATPACPTTN